MCNSRNPALLGGLVCEILFFNDPLLRHVMSRHFVSCHVASFHVMLRHFMSCRVISCHVASFHVMTRQVASCHIMQTSNVVCIEPQNHLIEYFPSNFPWKRHIASYYVMSHHVQLRNVMSRHVMLHHVIVEASNVFVLKLKTI